MSGTPSVDRVRGGFLAHLDWWFGGGALGPVRRLAAATLVAVGPWIVFVLSLAIISISSAPLLGREGLEDLRLTVTYSFCVAPLAAGPIGLAAAELARQSKEDNLGLPVFDIYGLALVLAGGTSAIIALTIAFAFGIPLSGMGLSFALLCSAAAMLWVCFAVLSAMKLFRPLIGAFLGGILLSVIGTIAAVRLAPSVQLLTMCFSAGLISCVSQSLLSMRAWQSDEPSSFAEVRSLLLEEIWKRRMIGAGVTLALIGIWADKWAFWLSPAGMRSAAGYLHYSRYDSVMFIAHLSMIPTFTAMLMIRETDLARSFKAVQARLQERSNHSSVRRSVDVLTRVAWSGGGKILFIQATIAGMLVLTAPWIARNMSFDFEQFIVLRFALLAVFLYSISYVACIFLLLCGRTRHFLIIQIVFVVANFILSVIFIKTSGFTAYPLFISSLIAAAIAWPVALQSLASYDYLFLLGENESLYALQRPGK